MNPEYEEDLAAHEAAKKTRWSQHPGSGYWCRLDNRGREIVISRALYVAGRPVGDHWTVKRISAMAHKSLAVAIRIAEKNFDFEVRS